LTKKVLFGSGFRCLLLMVTLLASKVPAWPEARAEVTWTPDADRIHFGDSKGGRHTLEIDDAEGFLTPVVRRVFSGVNLEVNAGEAGLIPGIAYHVRMDGQRQAVDLNLSPASQRDNRVDCAILRKTWELDGRFTVGTALSGMRWVGDHWVIKPHSYLPGEALYNVELVMRPALSAARACGDLKTLDEMAQYYSAMLNQTETVGSLLKRPLVTEETKRRLAATNPAARTFSASFGAEAGEGELYNSQWLHPAALLVRIVTLLPQPDRTAAMKEFAGSYSQFIVRDQLLRYLFEEEMPRMGDTEALGRVAGWEAAMRGLKGAVPWDSAMSDIDLWLLASAAEILGAHANDPELVPIEAGDLSKLQQAMGAGIRFSQSKRTTYPETKSFAGKVVGSASYFNGDYAAHSDMDFSAVGGEPMPDASEKRTNPQVSWDSSHAYRLAIFLRALYENRKATGLPFPSYRDLQLVANQYIYRVFTGDFARPRFRNYFDGGDGWFRVGYNGAGAGYPPSEYCDMHNPKRLCLMPGEIIGWAELAFANPDLARLQRSLVDLAFASDPRIAEFRDRHFFWNSPYKMNLVDGFSVYGGAFYFVAAENAETMAARN